MKKQYETPKIEKVSFNYQEQVVACSSPVDPHKDCGRPDWDCHRPWWRH